MAASPTGKPVPWEPVVTRPDPVTDQEWQSWADREVPDDLDPDLDEDAFWGPGERDLAEAGQDGIDAALREQDPTPEAGAGTGDADPAGVARELAAQEAAAQAKRRGPGQPGSARPQPRQSCSAAAAFGSGQLLDVMPACPELALFADEAAGPGDSYAGTSDDELIGVVCAWDRLEAHMAACKLAAIAALSRRRPVLDTPTSGRPAGSAPEDFTADELAHVLAESRRAARGLLILAGALEDRLPGTRALFRDGVLTLAKAKMMANKTMLLTRKEARRAEDRLLGRAGRLTPGSLRAAADQAIMEVAPEKAKQQREHAAKMARVERWGEDSGNGALAGRELPPPDMLAADERITWWAGQLRDAGLDGDLDQLRARAFLDLILSRDSRPGAEGNSVIPAGFTGSVNLTVPLTTALDLADRPGDLAGFGPVDPWLARDLLAAAAASPRTRWCVTPTDPQGHAVAHGCARPLGRPGPPGPGVSGFFPSPGPAATGRPADTAPGSCAPPAPVRTSSSNWNPSRPRTVTTGTRPAGMTPGPS